MDFRLAQKLTRELQLVLGEDPPKPTETSPRTKSASDTLEAAFEWDRVRRSAAPSPELLQATPSLVCTPARLNIHSC